MKRKKLICFILCLSAAAFSLLLTGCAGDNPEEGPVINPVDITISIDYPARSEMEDVEAVPFTIEENSSVLEAIQLYCNVNEMPVTVETTYGTVVGINDLLNGDIFARRTWQFKINGQLRDDPAGEVILKDGDSLEWVYEKAETAD